MVTARMDFCLMNFFERVMQIVIFFELIFWCRYKTEITACKGRDILSATTNSRRGNKEWKAFYTAPTLVFPQRSRFAGAVYFSRRRLTERKPPEGQHIPVPVWFFRGVLPRKNQTGTGIKRLLPHARAVNKHEGRAHRTHTAMAR